MGSCTFGYILALSVLGFLSRHHVEGASLSYMENNLRNYFSKTRHHDVGPDYKDRAKMFIRDEFQRLGLQTELQVFPDSRVSNTTNFTNVIGVLKGERFGSLSDRILGVGAHYDTVPTTPGVDDNGAAVVSMLEVARQLTEMNQQGVRRQNTIIFVSFDVEEEGLYGSEAFVKDWLLPFLQQNYGADYKKMKPYGFVVMDVPMFFNTQPYSQAIIAPAGYGMEKQFSEYFPTVYSNMQKDHFRGDFIALIYRNKSIDTDLAEAFRTAWPMSGMPKYELEEFPVPMIDVTPLRNYTDYPILSNFLRSDHARFWLEDYPAIFLSDTANFRNYGNVCYHSSCDSIDVYVTPDNMYFLGKTTDSIAMSLDLLSEAHGGGYTDVIICRMLGYFLMGGVLGFLTRNHAEGASLSYMEYSIRNYFSKTRHHDVGPDYKNRAKIFIRDEFQRFGLQTELQVFPDIRVSNKTNFTNVIGILKGERFGNLSDRILGVGAHYDTVPTTPGVDDNGAAVVSMLEVARQLTEMNQQGVTRQNTIIFVSFDTEEEGLFGSEIFVRDWFLPFLSRNYGHDYKLMKPYGFVVMDMPLLYNPAPYSQAIIAPPSLVAKFAEYFPTVYSNLQADQFRGDFIALVYRNGSTDIDLAHAFNAAWPTAGHQKFEIESFPLPDKRVARIWVNREFRKYPIITNFLRSDHTRFWVEDFPAIFLMDTLNYRNYGNVCYHGSCDNVDVYLTTDNMNFLAKTTDSIINSLHLLSQPNGSLPTGSKPNVNVSSLIVG